MCYTHRYAQEVLLDDLLPKTVTIDGKEIGALARDQGPTTAALPAVADKPTPAASVEAGIQEWVTKHVHNSPIAQSTLAYNHLMKHLSALKAAILGKL